MHWQVPHGCWTKIHKQRQAKHSHASNISGAAHKQPTESKNLDWRSWRQVFIRDGPFGKTSITVWTQRSLLLGFKKLWKIGCMNLVVLILGSERDKQAELQLYFRPPPYRGKPGKFSRGRKHSQNRQNPNSVKTAYIGVRSISNCSQLLNHFPVTGST